MRISKNRNGITLLFVVSIIVLFMLLATTFLVISSRYLRGAKSYSRSEIFKRTPAQDLEFGLYVLLRDTMDPNNPLRGHSILSDMYGYNSGYRGTATNPIYSPGTGNQVIQFEIDQDRLFNAFGQQFNFASENFELRYDHSLAGRTLTFISGPARGMSARITGYDFDDSDPTNPATTADVVMTVGIYPYYETASRTFPDPLVAINNSEFVINNSPFQGKGPGFNPAWNPPAGLRTVPAAQQVNNAGNVHRTRRGSEALSLNANRPNRVGESLQNFLNNYIGAGDVNEGHDAGDFNNMFLAIQTPSRAGGNYSATTLASFYRPSLINANDVRTFFSPPGMNPNPQVDNDHDGQPDSIWIDLNMPTLVDASGRQFKRLFAFLVKDLDGKLNLNAHSHDFHADYSYDDMLTADTLGIANGFTSATPADWVSGASTTAFQAGTPQFPYFPMGRGEGPAEINLRTLVTSNEDFRGLLFGKRPIQLPGRYGVDELGRDFNDGFNTYFEYNAGPGFRYNGAAVTVDDTTHENFFHYPYGLPAYDRSFGSVADLHGRFVSGLDYHGQPRFSLTTRNFTERFDATYEMELDDNASFGRNVQSAKDQPFSFGELERVIRRTDVDAKALPHRIVDLAPYTFREDLAGMTNALYNGAQITTASFEVPTPPTSLPRYLQAVFEQYWLDNLDPTSSGTPNTVNNNDNDLALINAFIAQQVPHMLPPGILEGRKMDINFPLGNGNDENGNGIVDESWGPFLPELLNVATRQSVDESFMEERFRIGLNPPTGVPFDRDNDGVINGDGDAYKARTNQAKYLYIMLYTIWTQSGVTAQVGNVPDVNRDGTIDDNDLAQWLAQFAINVVDFRDPDSIMTPFEYDIYPLNGWGVDDNPATVDPAADGYDNDRDGSTDEPDEATWNERGMVIGCERPELLFTETFAFHDRRTEDLDTDDGPGTDTQDCCDPDNDFDQRLKPVGALFLELFNPNTAQRKGTADIYGPMGIDLRRLSTTLGFKDSTTPNTPADANAPVWRIIVTRDNFDPDNPDDQVYDADQFERVIYFVPDGYLPLDDLRYGLPRSGSFSTMNSRNTFVLDPAVHGALGSIGHLGNAVIGTGMLSVDNDSFITPFGRRTDADESVDLLMGTTRSILMHAGSSMEVRDSPNDTDEIDIVSTRNTMAIPIQGLNISEPIAGYPATLPVVLTDSTFPNLGDDRGYATVRDQPLDNGRTDLPRANFGQNGTVSGFRYVHLQRLANPLVGWHPELNPYRTVDTMPVDLTKFSAAGMASNMQREHQIGGSGFGNGGDQRFGTRERGETLISRGQIATSTDQRLRLRWPVESGAELTGQTSVTANTANRADDFHFFHFYFENPENGIIEDETLGEVIGRDADGNGSIDAQFINFSYDYIANPIYDNGGQKTPSIFPELRWNNKPFVSQYGMMNVPWTSSSRLLNEYDVHSSDGDGVEYDPAQFMNGTDTRWRYGHLMPWFKSGGVHGDLHRIFDYTTVPSKYANSDNFMGTAVGKRAPYDRISRFREPGKMNVNTIPTAEVFNALKGGGLRQGGHHGDADFNAFRSSRQGVGGVNEHNNPFRSGDTGNLVPVGTNVQTGVESTFLRSTRVAPADPQTNALFDMRNNTNYYNQIHDLQRNSGLRYDGRNRMGNLTSQRSSLFSVQVTVGYFEVDPLTGNILDEIGSSTNSVQRHRGFYIIDRSIPVAFQPGENHNVDRMIKLRRIIE